jgi:ribonucleoside-diphosphate reductase alpha chain
MNRKFFDEDLALKQYALLSPEERPYFNWKEVVNKGSSAGTVNIKIQGSQSSDLKLDLNLESIAEMVGSALTLLMLAREEEDIFNESNKAFVARIAHAVGQHIKDAQAHQEKALSAYDIHLLIEKALIEHDAYAVAKSLLIQRSMQPANMAKHLRKNELEVSELRLIRRNGQVIPWDQNKVEIAVRKAFLSLKLNSNPSIEVARAVTERIRKEGLAFVDIEKTQNLVQEELMRQGHYTVAEAYILYRAYRKQLRESEATQQQPEDQQESLLIIKDVASSGTFLWDGSDLRKRIEFAMIGLDLCISKEQIEIELRRSLYAEMTLDNLQKTVVLNAKALIERDADFAKFAARILLSYIYEEVLDWRLMQDDLSELGSAHSKSFKAYLEHGIAIKRLDSKLLQYDLSKLAKALDPSADLDFDYLGIQTLYDRYLIVDKLQKPAVRIETPQFFWMRVAMGVCLNESNKEERAIALYNLYKSRRYCSSTPTLFNSGTLHPQLSSCYLYKVDDSIESIMYRGIAENAFLSKWAGGLGGSWTAVRGMGSPIKGTNGESKGLIPFLKLHNDLLEAVDQGGKRGGAGCAYLEIWHSDILAFLELRRNTGDDRRRTHAMNTANWIPDLFMKRVENRQDWTLFYSSEVPDLHELYGKAFEEKYAYYEGLAAEGKIFGKTMPALELWKKMLSMLYETGHPWITFKDPCNVRSPQDHTGVVHSSNLCTEITLNTGADETAVCNLGSVILDTHLLPDGSINYELLRDTVRIAVRALDNVIDINFYPTEPARNANMKHRPIGLGVMGLQNALYKKRIPFDSEAAIVFNDTFMEAIAHYAYEASSDLAAERGTYVSYKGSKWSRGLLPQDTLELLEKERGLPLEVPKTAVLDWKPLRQKIQKQGMRNSNVLAIAPTATIANIMGTSACIEPAYKNLFVKSNLSGDFIQLNTFLVKDLKQLGLWGQELLDQLKYFDGDLTHIESIPQELKQLYMTAFDISYEPIIKAAARRQKWIDQAQSTNLFLREPDLKVLSHMYRSAWHGGLKTTYYLRTLGASNIEKATLNIKKETRGVIGQSSQQLNEKRIYSVAEQQACSIESMMNGGTCEACQ